MEKLTEQQIKKINESLKDSWNQGIYKEPYGVEHEKDYVIYQRHERGGVSGGSCWDSSNPQPYYNDDDWDVGESSRDWTKHTNKNSWQQLEVCPETGFFDGQPVWCFYNNDTHNFALRFYDVQNKCTFSYKGKRGGYTYHNYKAFKGDYPKFILDAFKTLDRG